MSVKNRVIRGRRKRPERILLTGHEKVGKSTFASMFPDPLMITIENEEGADEIDCFEKSDDVETYEELVEWLDYAASDDCKAKTLIIDSISTAEVLLIEYLCREVGGEKGKKVDSIEEVRGGWGKGYVELERITYEFISLIKEVWKSGKRIIIIGHVIVSKSSDPTNDSYKMYDLDTNKRTRQIWLKWAEAIFFAAFEEIYTDPDGNPIDYDDEEEVPRYLMCSKSGLWPSGGRGKFGHMKKRIPLDYIEYRKEVRRAEVRFKKHDKQKREKIKEFSRKKRTSRKTKTKAKTKE